MVAFAVAGTHARPGHNRRIDHFHLEKPLQDDALLLAQTHS